MWFRPENSNHLDTLDGSQVAYHNGGFAQLQFEGIDALELHYRGSNHQRLPQCVDARDRLLELVGFTNVNYAPSLSGEIDTSVRSCSPDEIRGYIYTRNADPYGRPVAFVFVGNTSRQSGNSYWLNSNQMVDSLNAQLAEEGHVYPAFYKDFHMISETD
jgi:hypothetical protein